MQFSSRLESTTSILFYAMNIELAVSCLGPVDNAIKQRLGQVLWEWKLCGQCTANSSCAHWTCPWSRVRGVDAFWDHYERVTDAYIPEQPGKRRALNDQSSVLDVIQSIKTGRATPKRDLLRDMFESGRAVGDKPPAPHDQKRAFNIGASILLLMDFGILHDAANISAGPVLPIPWRDELSADNFVKEAFRCGPIPHDLQRMIMGLKAKKLISNADLRLASTNDIRRHLVLDQKEGIVWVFHQSSVLREFLSASENDPASCVLPRALMLEVLDTIHTVLFPSDPDSQKLLKSLVLKNGWDKGLLSDRSTPWRKETDPDITYAYFGNRLEELHKELQNPTPHGWLQRRLKRKSDSYMLKATVIGVLIAVTLSFLSLIVALFQAWVAYQQWKHPVKET